MLSSPSSQSGSSDVVAIWSVVLLDKALNRDTWIKICLKYPVDSVEKRRFTQWSEPVTSVKRQGLGESCSIRLWGERPMY
jgi:hypothetical protein